MRFDRRLQTLGSSLWSGRGAAASIQVVFGTNVPSDLANVSVNDYFRLVIGLARVLFVALSVGFRFTFHALSPCSGVWELVSQ